MQIYEYTQILSLYSRRGENDLGSPRGGLRDFGKGSAQWHAGGVTYRIPQPRVWHAASFAERAMVRNPAPLTSVVCCEHGTLDFTFA